jgi:alanine racemase
MPYKDLYSNWIEVDLGAIENNIHWICELTDVPVMAVVKANAYGHGTVPVARAAAKAGASWFGVARIEEALEIRSGGIDTPILILGYTPPAGIEPAINQGISLTIWNESQVKQASGAAVRLGKPARIHLKVDTDDRLGVQPEIPLRITFNSAGLFLKEFLRTSQGETRPQSNVEQGSNSTWS